MFKTQGSVTAILPEVTGQSPKGAWVKQSCIIRHVSGDYPKQMEITGFNAVAAAIKELSVGMEVEVTFQVESREYQERYYTTCFAISITRVGALSPISEDQRNVNRTEALKKSPASSAFTDDGQDLPF